MDSSSLYQFIRDVPITAWIATVVIILYTKYLHQGGKKYKRLPPGPKGYPILGTFPAFIGNEAHIVFDRKLTLNKTFQASQKSRTAHDKPENDPAT